MANPSYSKSVQIALLILFALFSLNSVPVAAKNACVRSAFEKVDDFYTSNVAKSNAAIGLYRDAIQIDVPFYHKKKMSAQEIAKYYSQQDGDAQKHFNDHLRQLTQAQNKLQLAKKKINKAKSMSADFKKLSELLQISCRNQGQDENASLAKNMYHEGIKLLAKQKSDYKMLVDSERAFNEEISFTKKVSKALLEAQKQSNQIKQLREHQQAVSHFDAKLRAIDNEIHQHLSELNKVNGIEGLLFIYDFDKQAARYTKDVAALDEQFENRLQVHLNGVIKYAQKNGDTTIKAQDVIGQYRSALNHIQTHISWYNSDEVIEKMAQQQQLAREILGPEEENLVKPQQLAENLFFNFAAHSKAADEYDMWKVAQVIGVKRFQAETGLDLQKNSPERQKQRHKERYKDSDIEPIVFGAPPEGVDYPHNFAVFQAELLATGKSAEKIANRNLLAINALASESIRDAIKKAITDYQQAMDEFKILAEKRFSISNWQASALEAKTWKELAQNWAIKEHKLMASRLQAIKMMVDAKAENDWSANKESLGFKKEETKH